MEFIVKKTFLFLLICAFSNLSNCTELSEKETKEKTDKKSNQITVKVTNKLKSELSVIIIQEDPNAYCGKGLAIPENCSSIPSENSCEGNVEFPKISALYGFLSFPDGSKAQIQFNDQQLKIFNEILSKSESITMTFRDLSSGSLKRSCCNSVELNFNNNNFTVKIEYQ